MQISPYFILICAIAAVIMFTFFATRNNISRRAAKEVAAALMLSFFALTFFGLSLLITDESLRFIFHELKFLPMAFVAPCSMMVYCEFTERPLPLSRKLLLCVIPLLSAAAALTNNLHHIFRKDMYVLFYNGVSYVGVHSAWGYWVYSVYSYLLYVTGIGMLAANIYTKPRIYRGQTGFMIFTGAAAIVLSLAVVAGVFPDYGDISLVTCAVVVIVQYITIVNYSDKRVVLNAWNLVVRDLDNLIMIFDHNDQLVDYNRDASMFMDMVQEADCGIDGSTVAFPEKGEYYSINEKRLYDAKDKYTGRVLVIKDVSGLENAVAELEYISTHDYLTGLGNRLAFLRKLQSLEEKDYPAALICVNIMGMKLINSIFGNEYGDNIIIRVALEMSKLSEDKNACMRMGGDEMGVILKNTSQHEAEMFIEKLKNCLTDGDLIEISLETNIAILTDFTQDAEQIFTDIAGAMRKSGGVYSRSISQGFLNTLQNALKQLNGDNGHRLQRLTDVCMGAADELSLSRDERKNLELLSVMSDIGQLSAPSAILKSKGDLTNEQWSEWKLHTIKGHNIALSIQELSGIAQEILSHHERYDGYGYPTRLKGEDIPILARILSAAEFYIDAPPDSAAALLQARSGTQFDPMITEAILSKGLPPN